MQSSEYSLSAAWKARAKTQHTVVGIRTWHVNLNPRAMPGLGFAKGQWQKTDFPNRTC